MPIYRYRCADCGAEEEHIQSVSDDPVETCSSCGGALGKLMTAAAFHLKGGGWYKDLYASSGSNAATDGGGAATSSDAANSGTSDSKASKDSSGSGSSGSSGSSDSGSSSSSTPTPSSGAKSA